MKKKANVLLFYLPRILAIFFIIYSVISVLDIFNKNYAGINLVLALIIHLIPTFILIFILFIAWKKELLGGILFIFLGIVYISKGWYFPFLDKLIISGPLIIIGFLFIINNKLKQKRGEKMACKTKKKVVKKKAVKKKKKR